MVAQFRLDNGLMSLSDDEACTIYHVMRFGSNGYPISKLGRGWTTQFHPVMFKTKRAAIDAFEKWHAFALERWREMKRVNPNLMLTGVGIRDGSQP